MGGGRTKKTRQTRCVHTRNGSQHGVTSAATKKRGNAEGLNKSVKCQCNHIAHTFVSKTLTHTWYHRV